MAYVISDQGRALLAAFRMLGLGVVSDCTHVMMGLVKKLFETDECLCALSERIGELRKKILMTPQGYLVPATLRDKDRFLRIFTIVDWWERIMEYWPNLPQTSRDILAFAWEAEALLLNLMQIKQVVEITAKLLKTAGLSEPSRQRWEKLIGEHFEKAPPTREAGILIESMREYMADHKELVAEHGRIMITSDVIESTFGRYKNKGGMRVISTDVLAIALYGRKLDTAFVIEALTQTHQKELDR